MDWLGVEFLRNICNLVEFLKWIIFVFENKYIIGEFEVILFVCLFMSFYFRCFYGGFFVVRLKCIDLFFYWDYKWVVVR